MDLPNSSFVQALVQPPPLSMPISSSASQAPLPPHSASPDPSTSSRSPPQSVPRFPDGVVVVGFIGRRPDDSIRLINRVIDFNVFGSGKLDTKLDVEKEEVGHWFKRRRISYYHEEETGILFLQFSSIRGSVFDAKADYDSEIQEHDFGDLQGMLFLFSVCHVIIYIQEGSWFDTNVLKKFKMLQSAKHACVRSRAKPPLPSRPRSSSALRYVASAAVSNNSSLARSGSRHASGISIMSGLGSYSSLFPGQCTPVVLFIFIDDFSDGPMTSSYAEGIDTISLNQSPNSDMLAGPVSKPEGGFRKKLQSSLEAQIRVLTKKCRTLTVSGTNHARSRGRGALSSSPLFSLDESKAVVLVERSAIRTAESLEFATSLMEDVLNGQATSDSLLLGSLGQTASKQDIVSLKEFISRQSDILRGGGGLVHSTSSGSAGGTGMVAAAAAASGKTVTTPKLPSMEIWLSSSQQILKGILSAKGGCINEVEISIRKPRHWHVPSASKSQHPLDIAVSWLESGKGLNMKFSSSWCERALPAAKEVYLRDLPAFYPTSQHVAHMEKAVLAFHSMVKGPAVPHFAKRLEEECKSIWKSGRQPCEAVSLTGKPCMHQSHSTENVDSPSETIPKKHSSGYVFLHACACGRSRRLRPDPFDFESANVTFNRFADCDNFLPVVQLPGVSITGHIQLSSSTLTRVGGAKYYEPSKGLLQSGFYPTQKFLFEWKISTRIRETPIDSSENIKAEGKESTSCRILMKQTVVYVGFEHECPHGHRFLLNPDHLKELGSSYAIIKESCTPEQGAACNLADPLKYGESGRHRKAHDRVNAANATVSSKERNLDELKDAVSSGSMYSAVSNSLKDLEKVVEPIGIEDNGSGFFMLNRDLPIFMNCPHCKLSKNKDPPNVKISGTISQLQRIFMVTPPFPIVLATHPVIQFEELCLPPCVPGRQQKLQFTFGCQVVLPPESFLTLRLPFVYGVQLEDGSLRPLNPLQYQPEATASIIGGTTLQIVSKSEESET